MRCNETRPGSGHRHHGNAVRAQLNLGTHYACQERTGRMAAAGTLCPAGGGHAMIRVAGHEVKLGSVTLVMKVKGERTSSSSFSVGFSFKGKGGSSANLALSQAEMDSLKLKFEKEVRPAVRGLGHRVNATDASDSRETAGHRDHRQVRRLHDAVHQVPLGEGGCDCQLSAPGQSHRVAPRVWPGSASAGGSSRQVHAVHVALGLRRRRRRRLRGRACPSSCMVSSPCREVDVR